jgi:hypothetical protein
MHLPKNQTISNGLTSLRPNSGKTADERGAKSAFGRALAVSEAFLDGRKFRDTYF